MISNVTVATFGGSRSAITQPLYQYDYGQILTFRGIDLPDVYEVHFSNEELGTAKTQIGGVDGVTIPDEYLVSGEDVRAWVFLHTGEDDGETEYKVVIPVRQRAKPSDEPPTPEEQSAIDQAIAALNIAVEKADTAVRHYPRVIDGYWHVWDVDADEYISTGVEAQGPRGEQGERGEAGPKGDTGETGPQGPKGDTGDVGPKGDKGDTGAQGAQGETGPKGDKGDKGDTGEVGPKGDKGDKGDTGPQGIQGPAGQDGHTPVRGTDYWTTADKEGIVQDVLDALDTAEGGNY